MNGTLTLGGDERERHWEHTCYAICGTKVQFCRIWFFVVFDSFHELILQRKKKQLFFLSQKMINTLNIINKLVSTPASDCRNEWKSKYKIIISSKSSVHIFFFLYFYLYTVSPTGRLFLLQLLRKKRGSVQTSHWFPEPDPLLVSRGFLAVLLSPPTGQTYEKICLEMGLLMFELCPSFSHTTAAKPNSCLWVGVLYIELVLL